MYGLTPLRSSLRTAGASLFNRSFSSSASRSFARITIVGRLGNQPELATSANGRELVKYTVASSHGPPDNRVTSWFRVASFMPEGNSRNHLLSVPKGSLIAVEGDASLKTYEDENGKKSTALNIAQRSYEVLSRGRSEESSEQS